jgi:hypothetical protein
LVAAAAVRIVFAGHDGFCDVDRKQCGKDRIKRELSQTCR